MTASGGTMGILWNKPLIRAKRYIYEFVNSTNYFICSFFSACERKILQFCGSKSGRNDDNAKETGWIPFKTAHDGVASQKYRLVFEYRKLYFEDFKHEKFVIPGILNYKNGDFHQILRGCHGKISNQP